MVLDEISIAESTNKCRHMKSGVHLKIKKHYKIDIKNVWSQWKQNDKSISNFRTAFSVF